MLFSAALIVKDEEKLLGQCLRSIQGLVDEIVVVDTGSTDCTRAIAVEHGARLYDFQWCDDFAAARNYALEQVRSQWVLYIDADEHVRPANAASLREMLEDPDFVAFNVQLHPRPTSTAYPELRIFRSDPRIRFQGRIHENIWPGIERYRSQHGGQIGASGLTIDHEGFEGDQQGKHHRNLRLLRMALRDEPDRVYCWCHLADIHAALGEDRDAHDAWNRALDIVRGKKQLRADDCLPYLGLAQWQLKSGQDVLPLLDEALSRFPANLQLLWLRGKALMAGNCFEDAISVFEHLVASGKTGHYDRRIAYDQRLLGELPLSLLAACHFQLKDYAASGRYFQLAAKSAPENLEYRVKLELCRKLDCTGLSTNKGSESQQGSSQIPRRDNNSS